jgi:hypothetical protein
MTRADRQPRALARADGRRRAQPGVRPAEVARVKDQRLAEIAQEQADPAGLA